MEYVPGKGIDVAALTTEAVGLRLLEDDTLGGSLLKMESDDRG